MWELFERRLEAEHYLGPSVGAQRLIDRLIQMPAEASGEDKGKIKDIEIEIDGQRVPVGDLTPDQKAALAAALAQET